MSEWKTIESAPSKQTVFVGQRGSQLMVTAYRIGPISGWRHAHSSD